MRCSPISEKGGTQTTVSTFSVPSSPPLTISPRYRPFPYAAIAKFVH